MGIIIFLLVLCVFTVGSIKIAANIIIKDETTLGTCFLAVILSIIANGMTGALLGPGLLSSFIAIIITGVLFGWLFKVNTLIGCVLALVSIAVQFGMILVAGLLGFALII
jgi:hypothetical protein